MQAKFGAQLGAGDPATGKAKHITFDGSQENLGRPESESRLKKSDRIKPRAGAVHRAISY
jgi:hypothetical protein